MVQPINLKAAGASDNDGAQAFRTVQLEGSCSLNGDTDVPCTMIGVALDSAIVLSAAVARFADSVILNLPHLGLQASVVSRVFPGGFAVRFAQRAHAKLSVYLYWIAASGSDGKNRRGQERIVPIRKLVGLTCPDGTQSLARIIDLSRSGAALTTSKALAIGDSVIVGRHAGRVVRLLEGGAAVHFNAAISHECFDAMIDLAVHRASAPRVRRPA